MRNQDLIECLRFCAGEDTDCLQCKRWEHDCGSAKRVDDLLLTAAERLETMQGGIEMIRIRYMAAKGVEKAVLGEVLNLLEGSEKYVHP